jgi:hypothetical protein
MPWKGAEGPLGPGNPIMNVIALYLHKIVLYKFTAYVARYVSLIDILLSRAAEWSVQPALSTTSLNYAMLLRSLYVSFVRARPIDLVEGIRRLASSRGAPVWALFCDNVTIDCSTRVFSRGLDWLFLCVINLSSRWEYLINDTVWAHFFWANAPDGS